MSKKASFKINITNNYTNKINTGFHTASSKS